MLEPIYTYKKGEGWIVSTAPLWLKGYEIKVGDVIDKYRMKPGDSAEIKISTGPSKVLKVEETTIGGDTYYGHSGFMEFDRNYPREWRVLKRS